MTTSRAPQDARARALAYGRRWLDFLLRDGPLPAPLTPARARVFVLAVGLLVAGIGVERALHGTSDFDDFHAAAVQLLHHGLHSTDRSLRHYPPTFQALLAPFGAMPLGVAAALWNLLNLAALGVTAGAIRALLGLSYARQTLPWLVAFPFAADCLLLCQSGPLLLGLAAGGTYLAWRGRAVVAGVVLGIGALLKVIPAIFFAVPTFLGRFRGAALGGALALVVGIGAVLATYGWELGRTESLAWFEKTRAESSAWDFVASGAHLRYNNQGLAITLARTFTDLGGETAKKAVRLTSFPVGFAKALYAAIEVAAAVLWLAAAWRCRRRADGRAWAGMLGMTALLLLIVSPIVWTHYFLWILPAMAVLADRRRLLLGWAVVSVVALGVTPLRALGFHMIGAVVAYVVVAQALWAEPVPTAKP